MNQSRVVRIAALATFLLAFVSATAHADRRAFVHTYEYMTMPEGDVELEVWNTQTRSVFGEGGQSGFDLQLEIEYGITSRWDIALYQVLEQADARTGLQFHETKLESRYRFAERGQWPIDTLIYMEVAKIFGEPKWELEPKLILARDFGRATVVVNLIPEFEFEKETEASGERELELEFEPGWAAGVTYEVSPQIKLGAETFGKADLGAETVSAWAGPSLSWAPSHKIWMATTAAFGLNSDSDDFVLRFIVGVGL